MTFKEKLLEIRTVLRDMALVSLNSGEMECAHEMTGAALVITNVMAKVDDQGLNDVTLLDTGSVGDAD